MSFGRMSRCQISVLAQLHRHSNQLIDSAAPVLDSDFWLNITNYLDCSEHGPKEADWTLDPDFMFESVEVFEMKNNGTFCSANSSLEAEDQNKTNSCFVRDHPQVESCLQTFGSRAKTFWIYFAIRQVFQV